MKYTNILWRILIAFLGIGMTSADGFSTLSHVIDVGMTQDIIAAVAGVIIVMALSLPICVWAFKNQNMTHGVLCAVVFITAWAVSYGFSVNRMGANRLHEAQQLNKVNLSAALAQEKIIRATERLDSAKVVLAREAVSGIGPKYKEAANKAAIAEADLKKAEAAFIQSGPTQHSKTFDQTAYLVYLLPFVTQMAGVVFMLIAFGEIKTKRKRHAQKVVEKLRTSVPELDNLVLEHLKAQSEKGHWESRYRQISKDSNVSVGAVKKALSNLEKEGEIIVDGCSKGRGTWGRLLA